VRRKEHDEWIAAEEWEIEWLESTHHEEGGRDKKGGDDWNPEHVDTRRRRRMLRDPKWWAAFGSVFAVGCVAGVLLTSQPRLVSVALASALGGKADARVDLKPDPRAELQVASKPPADKWAVAKPLLTDSVPAKPLVKALAVSQIVIPARAPDCESELHTLEAPNGQPWPERSSYVEGYPLGNQGEQLQLLVDNSANGSPVFVKVFDLETRSPVRHLYLLAHDSMTIDQLKAGRYELRYQNIDVGADKIECAARKGQEIKQAAISAG
jgi:hypothetical protein